MTVSLDLLFCMEPIAINFFANHFTIHFLTILNKLQEIPINMIKVINLFTCRFVTDYRSHMQEFLEFNMQNYIQHSSLIILISDNKIVT